MGRADEKMIEGRGDGVSRRDRRRVVARVRAFNEMNSYSFLFLYRYELLEASSRAASSRTSFRGRQKTAAPNRTPPNAICDKISRWFRYARARLRRVRTTADGSRVAKRRTAESADVGPPRRVLRAVVLLPREPALVK